MGGRDEAPSVSLSAIDAAARHNRVLLHALQTAHPVMYRNRRLFIHTLSFQGGGSGIVPTVWLSGQTGPVDPDEITLAPDYT